MAMASRYERGLFDPDAAPGESPFDHFIYVIASDGDMEEGVTSEASSLAGTQQLGNLIVFYDKNQISIEHDTNIALARGRPGAVPRPTAGTFRRSRAARTSSGIEEAIEAAKAVTDKPSFIALRTIIGYPAPTKMNTGGVHGSALGDDEVAATKKVLGFDPEKNFEVARRRHRPHPRAGRPRQAKPTTTWQPEFDAWAAREPERKKLLDRLTRRGTAGRLGRRHHVLGARLQGGRHPRGVRPGAQRRRAQAARAVGRLGRPRRQQQHHHQGREVVRAAVDLDRGLHGATGTAGCCTSASVSTPWARSCPASCCTARPARSAAPSCSSPTTCARRCGWRR